MEERERTYQEPDVLKSLIVIDKFEIGPVKIEKNRIITPYKITQDRKEDSIDLIYKYEEDVFDENDNRSLNLAEMITAQVAFNYGLFCKEIVFHGNFDNYDQKFIKNMIENTSREIYVIKFLQTNPFLIGKAASLPISKLDYYTQAKVTFATDKEYDKKIDNSWNIDSTNHAILSSGGKDSLLSFGLIKELGYPVHSIFINESGRHWYTALNAYRYFDRTFPDTTKVWTNCDRVFNWMLRHLPFIKKDFDKVRSDEYPIRLWTVAVFLFGALPLLKKRHIGRLIIGDEFDTTRRLSYHGITNYDGLYDQSRFFDKVLSRYFMQKGWGVCQFSIIRQLSEILIEKILAQRYPYLQKRQLSCHAAHIEENRVKPCGKCEKCRRIVGMLSAIDIDPEHCGYTKKQIQQCLKDIGQKGVHQELAGSQHLVYLLRKKGLISDFKKSSSALKPKSKIMKIRIDPERSPIDELPVNLRKPLFKIYSEYSDGALKRAGRLWLDYDILNDDTGLNMPYVLESKKTNEKSIILENKSSYILGELTWKEAEKRLMEVDIALLPVGAIEQHGPHLPLDTDTFDADYLAKQVADNCGDPKPLVFPVIPYGVSYHHEDFKGTISIDNETLFRLVYDIGMSAARNGITKLVIINGHGGNIPTLKFAAQMIDKDAHIFTTVDTGETSDVDLDRLCETKNDVHAGEIETSTSMAIRPHLVNLKHAKKFVPQFSSHYLNFSSKRSVEWFARTAKISQSGVMGDPTKATKEKGERMWEVMINNLVELVEQLKNMTLNEIYEKRY